MQIKTPSKEKEIKPNKRKNNPKKTRSKSQKSNKSHGRRVKKDKESKLSLPHIAPWKVIIGVILLGGLGVLYLHHVFSTKKLLNKVQAMEQNYKQSKRKYKLVRMKYDRLTGPVNITQKAREMGFVAGGPAKEIIEVESE